jgi:shikimate kinase
MHPSWIVGMEALNGYSDWVSSVVLPVAFQWIEEHKAEVYATVPEELRDDVGVVLAAAFKLVKELPAYKNGLRKSAAYEKAVADGTWDASKTNPVWTGLVKKIRAETEEAFAEQSSLLGDIPK